MQEEKKIPKNVIFLGLVSFFNDLASEMVYPLIPIFLTTFLGTPIQIVGLIEGVAEATASLLKIFSGWFSDKFQKRKIFVASGYSLSSVSKALIGLAASWHLVLFGRFIDRLGKGIRTSARDALITESAKGENLGRAFGFHRSLDTLGAVLGPISAIFILHYYQNNLRPVFYFAFIPGVLGVILLLIFVKEKQTSKENITLPKLQFKNLSPSFKAFLLVSAIFAIGNSSDAFIILKAKDIGLSTITVIWAYVLYNFVYAAASTPAGIFSDKIGPRRILYFGFLIFALIYFLLGLNNSASMIWPLFAFYGLYIAMTDGVGKAYISRISSKELIATTFGLYQTIIGICTLISSLFAGILWAKFGSSAPFYFGAALAFLAAMVFALTSKKRVT